MSNRDVKKKNLKIQKSKNFNFYKKSQKSQKVKNSILTHFWVIFDPGLTGPRPGTPNTHPNTGQIKGRGSFPAPNPQNHPK